MGFVISQETGKQRASHHHEPSHVSVSWLKINSTVKEEWTFKISAKKLVHTVYYNPDLVWGKLLSHHKPGSETWWHDPKVRELDICVFCLEMLCAIISLLLNIIVYEYSRGLHKHSGKPSLAFTILMIHKFSLFSTERFPYLLTIYPFPLVVVFFLYPSPRP